MYTSGWRVGECREKLVGLMLPYEKGWTLEEGWGFLVFVSE
jgi:hypothetical protein